MTPASFRGRRHRGRNCGRRTDRYEVHVHALNARVAKAVIGVPSRSAPFQDVTGWLSSLGMRYRRFYSEEDLEQLRTIFRRRVSIPIGPCRSGSASKPSAWSCSRSSPCSSQTSGRPPVDMAILTFIGVAIESWGRD